jgi:hypothetical protein
MTRPRARAGRAPTVAGTRDACWLFLAALIVYALTSPGPTAYDQYARLADAALDGHLSLASRPPHLEMAEYEGRAYFTNPPTPAILLLPLVWLTRLEPLHQWLARVFGNGWPMPLGYLQTWLSLFLGALNVALARIALGRVPVARRTANWGAVLFGFGSIHWYHATVGSVWYLAQIVHATAMWLLVVEWLGRARPALLGLALAAAFWCRMETIVAVPFVLVAMPERWTWPLTDEVLPRLRLGWLAAFAAPLAGVLVLNALYNWVRFGVFGNAAYDVLIHTGQGDPLYRQGLFSWSYWDRHVYALFKAMPLHNDTFPWVVPSVGGLAIWITTPAFIYALRAPLDRLTAACWLGIALFMAVLLQFGGTGMTQFGYRFALDFYPLLILLTMRGMDAPIRWWHMALIAVCIVVNTWGVLTINVFEIARLF